MCSTQKSLNTRISRDKFRLLGYMADKVTGEKCQLGMTSNKRPSWMSLPHNMEGISDMPRPLITALCTPL